MAVVLGFFLLFALAAIPEYGEGKHLHVYVSSRSMNWFKAYEFCRRKKKNLVTVMNNQDHWHLQESAIRCGEKCFGIGQHITHTWTAGADLHQNRKFVWMTTGQEVADDRWAANRRPDNWGGNEHCVEMFDIPTEFRAVLNDVPCGASMFVVCESPDDFGT